MQKSKAHKSAQKDFAKKDDSNHRVLSVKAHLAGVAPAREHSDHHQVLRLRTTFWDGPPGAVRQLDNNRNSIGDDLGDLGS